MTRAYNKSYTPLTPDPNGLFEDQTLGGAGDFTLDGAGVTNGVWASGDGLGYKIGLESTANLSGVTITLTGTDLEDRAITEDITGPNNSTVQSTYLYKTITSASADGAVGTNIEAGPVDEAISKIYPCSNKGVDQYALAVDITGTVNYDIEYTFQNVYTTTTSQDLDWQNHSEIAGETTSQNSYVEAIPAAFRLVLNSYTSGCTLDYSIIPNVT